MEINLASHPEQRVAIFIDTQNLYHSAKSNFRTNVNYQELIKVAVNGRKLIRAFAYVIKSDDNTESKFFDALGDIGIEMRVKDLQVFHTGAKKADWDVGIAVDMIRLTEKVDVIVLASGDGDFLEVVRYCQSRGVRIELMAFEKTTNATLLGEVDHFTDLGDRDSDFLIGNKRISKRKTINNDVLEKGSEYLYKQRLINTNVLPATVENLTVEEISSNYNSNNLSQVNRQSQNVNKDVDLSIYSRSGITNETLSKKVRKIKPVVGLPGRTINSSSSQNTLIKNKIKADRSLNNAFGNKEPKKRGFNY